MSKYQNAKIYKIVSNAIDQVYIGSTYQALSARMSGHRKNFKRYMNGLDKMFCTSFSILEYGDAEIILIENCPCESKEELKARERFHIENNNCVNKKIPGRTMKEYKQLPEVKEKNNKQKRENYHKNKDAILERERERIANDPEYREKKNKQKREKRANDPEYREKLNKQKRESREKNKDAINEQRRNDRVICEYCGCESQKCHLRRHQRTKKCLAFQ